MGSRWWPELDSGVRRALLWDRRYMSGFRAYVEEGKPIEVVARKMYMKVGLVRSLVEEWGWPRARQEYLAWRAHRRMKMKIR